MNGGGRSVLSAQSQLRPDKTIFSYFILEMARSVWVKVTPAQHSAAPSVLMISFSVCERLFQEFLGRGAYEFEFFFWRCDTIAS